MKTTRFGGLFLGVLGFTGGALGCSQAGKGADPQLSDGTTEVVSNLRAGVIDPGPRAGAPGAGSASPGLTAAELTTFEEGQEDFEEIDSVSGTIEGEAGSGLGPTFNATGCADCHAHPSVGGTSPALNPQIEIATRDGARNPIPSFITADGPVREARFIAVSNANNAALDGGVHGLFTIRGRSDAPGCNLAPPDFATHVANHNVIFRIPTPVFGLGLVEATTDEALVANLAANSATKASLGIKGRLNTNGNDGTTTRFGWKAQNKSLTIFAGEAYNVEQGVSNEGFTQERSAVPGCVFNAQPEDPLSTNAGGSDVVNFANFMRLTAPPTPAPLSASAQRGSGLFESVGCVHCHSRNLTTGPQAQIVAFSNVTYHPFSDFAIHHMGSTLADGVNQGAAQPDEFRTAPLWGLGQRLFFLHDGRARNLGAAIAAHVGPGNTCVTTQDYQQFNANGMWFQPFVQTQTCAGEANQVIARFDALSATQQQDLLNFLRSL
jgi:CxxC motif-containing protein (DUF1111 family)